MTSDATGDPGARTRDTVVADLVAEGDELDRLVAGLDSAGWVTPTPATGWSVAHQIAHLASTDVAALASVRLSGGPRGLAHWLTSMDEVWPAVRTAGTSGWWLVRRGPRRWSADDLSGLVDALATTGARTDGSTLLARWRAGRNRLAAALADLPDRTRLRWFGGRLSVAAVATARLMETWAHGQDIADGLGVTRAPTGRLRHIARLGVRTRDFAYRTHRLDPPAAEFRVELTAPDGSTWAWGPEAARDVVTGPALDFCLLVTRRRHPDDLDLTATGDAGEWLLIAQAYAGSPGPGRLPERGPAPG
jgi:uncharacterized protein (TIGR03084 family)